MVKGFAGGDRLKEYLRGLSEKLGSASSVNVGFLEGATYEDGTPVAAIAAAQEFGDTITIPEHEQTIFRSVNATGTAFLRNGKFVKRSKANFESTHTVPEHTVTIPPRPFFRHMIAKGRKRWGGDAALALKACAYNTETALNLMGEQISGELAQSIKDFSTPPNAPSTIAKKGFDQPLIDKGTMWRSIDYEVKK